MTAEIHKTDRATDDIAPALLEWYDAHCRDLPWRTPPNAIAAGKRPDPYHVWLSEIMLQQTTVAAVKPYFLTFIERWPDVAALAAAGQDEIMRAWAGLGYYSRARNLHKCARAVTDIHGGRFPDTEAGLKALPGIGDYTAGAIAAIAFNMPAIVVDGNVERVITRLRAIATALPAAKPQIRAFLASILPHDRPGDFAQAMMDLGATICTPKRPACIVCPLRQQCTGLRTGDPALYPLKAARRPKPKRRGAAFVARRADGAVLLRKRAEKGLLAGMTEVPTTGWSARVDGGRSATDAPFAATWKDAGSVAHVFTHFELELTVYLAHLPEQTAPAGHWWSQPQDIHSEALPTVMKKVIEAAIPGATRKPGPVRRTPNAN
ncbi:A/G-specific adenine glycosylase [Mesorhizobium xinjiangense]|uniref:A/G-specific adenine glycosylase n=1 Tax=Mesorhizobium xinjiangense TaxID=2678685 RepID=UPI0012ED668A|nr:A/G-specific adenine glycosylase [Mesorhizobium xinjiangense]